MIYLDNAATTNYKPRQIVDAVTDCILNYSVNPNRGAYGRALELEEKLCAVRKKISLLYNNGNPNKVIFCSGCTQALNMAVIGLAQRGHVIISATEHNAVLRPVMQLKRKGIIDVSVVFPNEKGEITAESVEKVLRKDTYMLCVAHVSNVTGKRQNLAPLGLLAKRHGLKFVVDCAQSAGYLPLDLEADGVSAIAFGGHKGLHGIAGAGVLVLGKEANPSPITFGGTGTESENPYQPSCYPEKLEAGTLPCPAIISIDAGIDYWLKNWKSMGVATENAQELILRGLKSIGGVKVYSESNKSGIVAFNVGEKDSNAVADRLWEKFAIAVRGGLHCAPLMHRYLKTEKQGAVRASVSCVTTKQECFALLNAVEYLAKKD